MRAALGNCRLVLPGLYVDRQVATTPQVETRDLKSLFKPKSARVLRYLLKRDQTARRLSEIAEVLGHKTLQMVKRYAHLSEAHTTKVIRALNDRLFTLRITA